MPENMMRASYAIKAPSGTLKLCDKIAAPHHAHDTHQ
jgi:hypothetical protein